MVRLDACGTATDVPGSSVGVGDICLNHLDKIDIVGPCATRNIALRQAVRVGRVFLVETLRLTRAGVAIVVPSRCL